MNPNVVVVTGAATGIGRLSAELLARSGYQVYASMRDPEGQDRVHAQAIEALALAHGLAIRPLALDVLREDSCRAAADLIVAQQGRIDVVVNNAGMLVLGVTEAFRSEQVLEAVNTNALSWLRVNRAFLPAMRRQGRGLLVYVGSSSTQVIDPFIGPYAASKAAGEVLALTMAVENSAYGIESVIVVPGAYTRGTAHFEHARHAADQAVTAQYSRINHLPPELPERLNRMHGPGIRTDPAEVAEAIRDAIALPHGERPLRVVVDPQRRGMEALFALQIRLQEDAYRRMGIESLLRLRIA